MSITDVIKKSVLQGFTSGDMSSTEIMVTLGITFLIGLYIFKWSGLKVVYPFLAALGIAFVDALPILRSRNSNDTLGNIFIYRWKCLTCIIINWIIYSYISSKANG